MRCTTRVASVLTSGAVALATFGLAASAVSAEGTIPQAANRAVVFDHSSATITNPYLPISKFHRTVLKGVDTGQRLRVVRTLRRRTKEFRYHHGRVEAAVVMTSSPTSRRIA